MLDNAEDSMEVDAGGVGEIGLGSMGSPGVLQTIPIIIF